MQLITFSADALYQLRSDCDEAMPTTHDRVLTLCQEIADWLRAVAMDVDETLTLEERRALIDVALEVERRGARGRP